MLKLQKKVVLNVYVHFVESSTKIVTSCQGSIRCLLTKMVKKMHFVPLINTITKMQISTAAFSIHFIQEKK